jgi:hypothetical protein
MLLGLPGIVVKLIPSSYEQCKNRKP